MTASGRTITDAEVAAYHDKGVVVCRNLIPAETMAAWRSAWLKLKDDLAAGRAAPLVRTARFVLGADLPGPIGAIYAHPTLVDSAKRILGPDVALYMNRMLVKDEHWDGDVTPHQDCVYFHGMAEKLTAFVPLEEFTKRTGAVNFIEGSHKFGNLGIRGTIRYDDWPAMPELETEAYPGDVIFASFTVWHHSQKSEVITDRPLVQVTYQSAADGTYYGQPDRPVLVAGDWRTQHFSKFQSGVTPDA